MAIARWSFCGEVFRHKSLCPANGENVSCRSATSCPPQVNVPIHRLAFGSALAGRHTPPTCPDAPSSCIDDRALYADNFLHGIQILLAPALRSAIPTRTRKIRGQIPPQNKSRGHELKVSRTLLHYRVPDIFWCRERDTSQKPNGNRSIHRVAKTHFQPAFGAKLLSRHNRSIMKH